MNERLTLIWASRNKLTAGQQLQLHTHTCHQLYYIIAGTPRFLIDGQLISCKPGDFFTIPAGMPHQVLELDNAGMESYELKVVLADPFLTEHLRTFHQPIEDKGAIYQTLRYIARYWTCQEEQNLEDIHCLLVSMLLQLFVGDLRYKDPGSRYIKTDRYNAVTRQILSYVDNHFTGKFSVEKMGKALNYHPNYLSTTFCKNTGFAITDYLNYVRIRRAVHHFAFYGQDVFTTYESTGFSSLSYFSRTFKAMVGISPRDFRRVFSSLSDKPELEFANEPILNFQPCTMEDGLHSMQNLGKYASDYLKMMGT